MHIIRYHGVFAPHSKARPDVVKRNKVHKKPEKKESVQKEELVSEKLSARSGKETKILSAILERKAIVKILSHLGLPTDPPIIHPARAPPQTAWDLN